MDPRLNPYTPGAGVRPPALVGRDREIESFDLLLERLKRGRSERSVLITGLRGVGKTVLLGAFAEQARLAAWACIEGEISSESPFGPRMALLVRRALLELAPRDRWRQRLRRAAGVLRSFSISMNADGSMTGSVDVDPIEGLADSGELGEDLSDLFVAVGEAAREHESGVVFLLDEIQFLERGELEALIRALHRVSQRQLPLALAGAGLPNVARLAGEAKSYAERLFTFPVLGPLPVEDAREALIRPAAALDVTYDRRAVEAVMAFAEGYPYFIQEYGDVLWDHAAGPEVTAIEAVEAQALVEARLDSNFFRVRIERASEQEVGYMRAMAELGPEPQTAAAVAAVLHRRSEQLGKVRTRLIEKGLLYAPAYGRAAFTVPQFDRFLRRTYPSP